MQLEVSGIKYPLPQHNRIRNFDQILQIDTFLLLKSASKRGNAPYYQQLIVQSSMHIY